MAAAATITKKSRRVRNDLKTGNPVTDTQSEPSFQAQVEHLAKTLGWRCYHTFNAYKSAQGFPDNTLVKGNRLIFAELKRQTGDTTADQEAWLEALRRVPGIEVFVWRPSDWDAIVRILA